ncbi:hypothetical protein GCM10011390_31270 [Aureimonas endophytica]|uniref:Uncharacterized protein n=1 Tax=Aureimonas endophytica TaxID=2027858 RepID=A0A917E6T9_9HYPH|nr:hypothetical protein [Aureimonas endophytica]GGE09971.1 hypothetical protein GCM10011390_31270 [Aureimonas endophytica]
MTDTDSEMMLRQQNLDTPQTIDGLGPKGPADLDEEDGRDRRRALEGAPAGAGSQDDVLAQNTRGMTARTDAHASDPARRRLGGLVRKGRSLLGA